MCSSEVMPVCVHKPLGAANLRTRAETKLQENSHTRQISWRGICNKLFSQYYPASMCTGNPQTETLMRFWKTHRHRKVVIWIMLTHGLHIKWRLCR